MEKNLSNVTLNKPMALYRAAGIFRRMPATSSASANNAQAMEYVMSRAKLPLNWNVSVEPGALK